MFSFSQNFSIKSHLIKIRGLHDCSSKRSEKKKKSSREHSSIQANGSKIFWYKKLDGFILKGDWSPFGLNIGGCDAPSPEHFLRKLFNNRVTAITIKQLLSCTSLSVPSPKSSSLLPAEPASESEILPSSSYASRRHGVWWSTLYHGPAFKSILFLHFTARSISERGGGSWRWFRIPCIFFLLCHSSPLPFLASTLFPADHAGLCSSPLHHFPTPTARWLVNVPSAVLTLHSLSVFRGCLA